ncbi:hypothetical protein ACIHDR_46840 [Nocardia sp. NPDC052278]|uniref:hypothetical protein n=1 Tax=unclassified Nocardia TaxID=2637762 RepID=UPI003687B16A
MDTPTVPHYHLCKSEPGDFEVTLFDSADLALDHLAHQLLSLADAHTDNPGSAQPRLLADFYCTCDTIASLIFTATKATLEEAADLTEDILIGGHRLTYTISKCADNACAHWWQRRYERVRSDITEQGPAYILTDTAAKVIARHWFSDGSGVSALLPESDRVCSSLAFWAHSPPGVLAIDPRFVIRDATRLHDALNRGRDPWAGQADIAAVDVLLDYLLRRAGHRH